MNKKVKDRTLGGLWGAVIGDALGVPVEFRSREERKQDPVAGMRGFRTHYQPPGTWSDDTSLLLCTVESLINYEFDLCDMGQRFAQWYRKGHWTPWGEVFDIGETTQKAIERIEKGAVPEMAGDTAETSNGNGSLKRVLPVALRFANSSLDDLLGYVYRVSSVTHRHPHSLIACGFYCLMVVKLLEGLSPLDAYTAALATASKTYARRPYRGEMSPFTRFISGRIHELPESDIESGHYVLDTLEASTWCLINSASFKEAVLKSVNLGKDTDSTGCVTGGLAGVHYGVSAIPEEWIKLLVRRDDIKALFEAFVARR